MACLELPRRTRALAKRVKRKFKRGNARKRTPAPTTIDTAEKSAGPPTSTTVSPQQSPFVPTSASIPQLTRADPRTTTHATQPTSPTPQNPSAAQSSSPYPLTSIGEPNIIQKPHQQSLQPTRYVKNQVEPETTAVDSDSDNLDRIFEEAWEPGNSLSLADGTPLPWSKGRSSPSTAARYLDDIQDGLQLDQDMSPTTSKQLRRGKA